MPPPGRLAVHNAIDVQEEDFHTFIHSLVWSNSGGRHALRNDALALVFGASSKEAMRFGFVEGGPDKDKTTLPANDHDRHPGPAPDNRVARLRMSRCERWTMSIDEPRIAARHAPSPRLRVRPESCWPPGNQVASKHMNQALTARTVGTGLLPGQLTATKRHLRWPLQWRDGSGASLAPLAVDQACISDRYRWALDRRGAPEMQ
jgi:hypothetical protein